MVSSCSRPHLRRVEEIAPGEAILGVLLEEENSLRRPGIEENWSGDTACPYSHKRLAAPVTKYRVPLILVKL